MENIINLEDFWFVIGEGQYNKIEKLPMLYARFGRKFSSKNKIQNFLNDLERMVYTFKKAPTIEELLKIKEELSELSDYLEDFTFLAKEESWNHD